MPFVADPDRFRTSIADDLGSLGGVIAPTRAAQLIVPLAEGTVIGEHFVIEDAIGSGGMGIVYRAHDRALDRRVALKIDARGLDVARARREAQALARLAHPNVVTIHEIGVHDGSPFVAMELCAGGTARSWLRARPRSWRDVLALYLAAARGLVAAHDAGLVHRDVKPDNILLGADDRARIGDFGLARDVVGLDGGGTVDRAADADEVVTRTTTSTGRQPDHVTATGAVVGTPRYMAPEQRRGGQVDARADQFSFALALYEALAGADPFPAAAEARIAAIEAGVIAPPARDQRVPRRVLAVLSRGLAADPARRWPSMAAMVSALERAARPRWPWIAGALVVVLAGGAATAFAMRSEAAAPGPDPCAGVVRDLASAWTPGSRAGFLRAHGKAAATASWTADVLDHHTASWAAARTTICIDAVRDPQWSADLVTRAVDCLRSSQRELVELAAIGDVAQGELVGATSNVADPVACGRREQIALTRTTPLTPAAEATRDAVIALASDSERAADSGDVAKARALAGDAMVRAAAGPPIARALAAQAMGRLELATSGIDAAAEHFKSAFFDFRSVSDGSHTFATALQLAQAYAGAGKADLAAEWVTHARAEAERLGGPPWRTAMLESLAALVARARGDHAGAVTANQRGIDALEATGNPVMTPNIIRAYATHATLLAEAGRLDDSIAAARRALAQQEQLLGPDHPDLITSLTNIGLGYSDQGKIDEALPWLMRAKDLADRSLPRDSMPRAMVYLSCGEQLAKRRPAEAVPMLQEVVRIVELSSGKDSDDAKQVRAMLDAATAAAKTDR